MKRVAILGIIFSIAIGALGLFGSAVQAASPIQKARARSTTNKTSQTLSGTTGVSAISVGTLGATLHDGLAIDNGVTGAAEPGDTLSYTVVISHQAADNEPYLDLNWTVDLDDNLTYVPGSLDTTPLAYNDHYTTLQNIPLVLTETNGVLASHGTLYGPDIDLDGDTLTVTAVTNEALASGGQLTLDAQGALTYTPPINMGNLTEVYTYTVTDEDGHQTEAALSFYVDPRTIIFVDNSLAAAGTGSLAAPYNDINTAFGAAGTGDRIFLYEGTGTYNVTTFAVQDEQIVVGEGFTGPFAEAFAFPAAYVNNQFPTPGTKPIISCSSAASCLTLPNQSTVRGLTISHPGTTYALTGSSFTHFTASNLSLISTGSGLSLSNGEVNASFDQITAADPDAADEAIELTNLSGTIDLGELDIQNGEQSAVFVNDTNGALTVAISGGEIAPLTPATADDHGIDIQLTSSAQLDLQISNLTLDSSGQSLVALESSGTSAITATLANITIPQQLHDNGIDIDASTNSQVAINLSDIAVEQINGDFITAQNIDNSAQLSIYADQLQITETTNLNSAVLDLAPQGSNTVVATIENSTFGQINGDLFDLDVNTTPISLTVNNSLFTENTTGDVVAVVFDSGATATADVLIANSTFTQVQRHIVFIGGTASGGTTGQANVIIDQSEIFNSGEAAIKADLSQQMGVDLTIRNNTVISGSDPGFQGILIEAIDSSSLDLTLNRVLMSGFSSFAEDAITLRFNDNSTANVDADHVEISNIQAAFVDGLQMIADGNAEIRANANAMTFTTYSVSSADAFVIEVDGQGQQYVTATNIYLEEFGGTPNRAFHIDAIGDVANSLDTTPAQAYVIASNVTLTNFPSPQGRAVHVEANYGNQVFLDMRDSSFARFSSLNSHGFLFELDNGGEVTATLEGINFDTAIQADAHAIEVEQNISIDSGAGDPYGSFLNLSVISSTLRRTGHETVKWSMENEAVGIGLFQGNTFDAPAINNGLKAAFRLNTGSSSTATLALTLHDNLFTDIQDRRAIEMFTSGSANVSARFTENRLLDPPDVDNRNLFWFIGGSTNACLDLSDNEILANGANPAAEISESGSGVLTVAQATGTSFAQVTSDLAAANPLIENGVSVSFGGTHALGSCSTPALFTAAAPSAPLLLETQPPIITQRPSPNLGKLPTRDLFLPASAVVPDLSFTIPALLPDQALTITFRAEIANPLNTISDVVVAQGRLTSTTGVDLVTRDPTPDWVNHPPSNNETITPLLIDTDVAITKTVNLTTAAAGEFLTYTIVVKNRSTQTSTIAVSDTIDAPTSFVALDFSCIAVPPSTCSAPDINEIDDQTAELAAGDRITYTVVGQLHSNLPASTITNTAQVFPRGAVTDSNTTDNSDQVTTTVFIAADLIISKTAPATGIAGQPLTYTIIVANEVGPSDLTGVVISDTFDTAFSSFPFGWTCVANSFATCGNASGSNLNLNETADLTVGGRLTYTAIATPDRDFIGTITNTATVTHTNETDASNNSATAITVIAAEADLSIEKSVTPATAIAGQTPITYTVVARNAGPSHVDTVLITDTLSSDLQSVVWSTVNNGGATGFPVSGSGDIAESGKIEAGGAITFTITGTPASAATATSITNTATISGSVYTETNPSDNQSSLVSVSLTRAADLNITKSVSPTIGVPGETVTYTLVISNAGPSDGPNSRIQDTLPTEIDTGTVSWQCDLSSGTCPPLTSVFDLDETITLTAGSVITYIGVGTINSAVTGTITNTATVTVPTPVVDPQTSNNSAQTVTSLQTRSDLAIALTASADPVTLDQPLAFTVVFSNAGPSRADSTAVTVTLPSQFVYQSDTCGGTNTTSWRYDPGPLTAGQTMTCTIQTQVSPAAAAGPASTNALIASIGNSLDPNVINNETGLSVTVVRGEFDIADSNTVEGNVANITVTLSAALPHTATVSYTSTAHTALSPADFVAATGVITFAPNITQQLITISTVAETLYEAAETFTMTLGSAQVGVINDGTAVVTILNDDAPPTITLTTKDINEDNGPLVYTATLSAISALDATFNYAITDGTATAGSDYVAASGTATITAGSLTTTITTSVTADTIYEPDETVLLTISALTEATAANSVITATLLNDEALPSFTISDTTVSEATSPAVLTLTSDVPSTFPITLTLNTANDAAQAPSDYTALTSQEIVLPAESQSITVSVPIIDNALYENTETFTVTISSVFTGTLSDAAAQVTILDNDAPPTVTLSTAAVVEDNGPLVFTATLSAASALDVTFVYTSSDGTATAGSDYTAVNNTATILAGSTSITMAVPLTADTTYELDETVRLDISSPSNSVAASTAITGTILNDEALPALSILDNSGSETDGTLVISITSDIASVLPITVTLNTTADTATTPEDFNAISALQVTIPAGAQQVTTTLTLVDDSRYEVTEALTATLSAPIAATISDASARFTITDNDPQPALTLSTADVAEDSGILVFTATLSAASGLPTTFNYAINDGTATAPADYAAATGSATISADTLNTTMTTTIVTDTIYEADETVQATISSLSNGTAVNTIITATILNDEALPAVSIADNTVAEPDGSVAITITSDIASAFPITLSLSTSDNSALAASDYTAVTNLPLVIPAGTQLVTTTILISDNLRYEATEQFTVTMTSVLSATVNDDRASITITDNEAPPVITLTTSDVAENSGPLVYTATLSALSDLDVTWVYTTANGLATAPVDYLSATGQATITAGTLVTTIPITINPDTLFETDETVRLDIGALQNATTSSPSITATILNDDAPPAITIYDTAVAENEGSVQITLTSNVLSAFPVTMTVSTANNSALSGSDYTTINNQQVILPPNQSTVTTTIPILNDIIAESLETFTVTVTSILSGTLANDSAIITINDDDSVPELSIADASASETAGTLVFTITSSTLSGLPATADVALSSGTALLGTDFDNLAFSSITLPAGAISTTFTVTLTDDLIDEPITETFNAVLSNPINAILDDAAAIGTIIDNDNPPTLSIADLNTSESAGTVGITLTLSITSGQNITLNLAATNDTATAGTDFTPPTNPVVIPAGTQVMEVPLTIIDDTITEHSESFTLTVTTAYSDVVTISDDTAVVTLTDNDPDIVVSFSQTSYLVNEGSATAQITITLNNETGFSVPVAYSTQASSATAPDDFALVSGVYTFTAGITETAFTVSLVDDGLDEPDERVALLLSTPTRAAITISTIPSFLIIEDNDGDPTVRFGSDTASYNEADGTVLIPVYLSNPSSFLVDVNYTSANGTAVANSDYTSVQGTLSYNPGETIKYIELPLLNDAEFEGTETFQLILSDPIRATLGLYPILTIDLNENSAAPTLSINDISLNEGDSGSQQATLTISKAGSSTLPITVTVSTANNSALSGSDYTAINQTIRLEPSDTSKTVTVTILGDTAVEPDEQFFVNLSGAVNATLSDAQAVVTITNDDNLPPHPIIEMYLPFIVRE